ncbi:MAG: flagellar hook-length control protein FliK [Lachnospiraceae bacterium]|nr:flagellar hook-length control protein FliK [Lachnospiraceae bacterium]
MTIAPITGIMDAVQAGMPAMPAPAAKESDKGDFMQTFQSAKEAQAAPQPVKTEGTGAKGKDSDTKQAEKGNASPDDNTDVRKNDRQAVGSDRPAVNKAEKTKTAEQPAETGNDTSSEPDEIVMETISANVAQLLEDILGLLGGGDLQELTDAFTRLDLKPEDLLSSGSANLLVADFLGEGDLAALVTDSNLSDIAGEINQKITELLGEVKQLLPEEEPLNLLKPVVAEELGKMTGNADVNENIARPAVELPVSGEEIRPVQQPVQTGGDSVKQESGQGSDAKDERRTDRFAHEDLRGDQNVFAPEMSNAEAMELNAEDLRPEAELLRYASDPRQILEQVADRIKTQVGPDMSSLEMVLHPASLGNVALNLVSRDGSVTAQLTAQSEAVKEALESQLVVLRQNLEQAGVKVTAVEVTVGSHAFEQNLEQGNDGQSDAEAKEQERLRRATRKIDLGLAGDEPEVDEADAVTVEMMQADGNRMDYKA